MKTAVHLLIVLAAILFTVPSRAQSPGPQTSTADGTRLVLLGTAGGPSIKRSRAQPANALIVNGSVYIIDAGNGVARQMALANISPQALRAVFITHLHSDHTADYGTLLLRAWLTGLKNPVDTYGPAPIEEMTRAYMRYMDWDIQLRTSDENRPPFAALVRAHNIAAEGVVFQDENVKVTAVEVPHGAAKASYAFRFDTPTRSIVFSGDTSRSSSLVRLAKGADILVHEVLNTEGVDAAIGIGGGGANEALKRHIIEAHTPIEEVGQVAHDAGVKKLVLTHFVPSLPAFDKPEIWLRGARKFYGGEIIVGQDLLNVE